MNPELAAKLLLEQEDEPFDAGDYVKAGGDESAEIVYEGPLVRIIIPLTVHTLNDYFFSDYQWSDYDFTVISKDGPLYAVYPNEGDHQVAVLQFETRKVFNKHGMDRGWNEIKAILSPEAMADMTTGFVQYFQAQIAAKKNPRQAVANLVLLGRSDLAVNYGRYLGHAKLPTEKAIEAALAAQKAGHRQRNKIARFMQGQQDVEWGNKGFYLLFDDWVDTAPFFGRTGRYDYEKNAKKIFSGDAYEWFDANIPFKDAWDYVDDKNENLIRQLLVGRACLNDDEDEFVVTKEDVDELNNKEIGALLNQNRDGATEDIANKVVQAANDAEQSSRESAFTLGYEGAFLAAFGQDEAHWRDAVNRKGEKISKLAVFVPYSTLEEWLDKWKDDNYDEEFDGQIHDLALDCVEKVMPNDDYYADFDSDYFNNQLNEGLGEIDMVQPDHSDPVQPELPLEGEPAPIQVEPEYTAKVSVGEHPNEKVYKDIPSKEAAKYVKAVPNTSMQAESIVTSLLEQDQKRSSFHMPENFEKVKEGPGWEMHAGANDWEIGWSAACVLFPGSDGHCERIWADIGYPDGNDDGEVKHDLQDACEKRGKEAVDTWIKIARSINGSKGENGIEMHWKEAFAKALKHEEVAPFMDDHGSDETQWAKKVIEALGGEEDDPKEFLERNPLLMYPTPEEVMYTIEAEPEDDSFEGHFDCGDEAANRRAERWIRKQLDNGNEWGWCSAHVMAIWVDPDDEQQYEGNAYLGCCSYKSEKDFCQEGGYFKQMKEEAYDELVKSIKRSRDSEFNTGLEEAVTGATRETVDAILAQIKEVALASESVEDFKRVATERLAPYRIQFEPYASMPANANKFPGAVSTEGIYLAPPASLSPHSIDSYIRRMSRVLFHEMIHTDQIDRSANPDEMQASAERLILGNNGELNLGGYTRQKQEIMAHAGTLVDDWQEEGLSPDEMRARLRTGAWDSGVGHSALQRTDPKLYNLFLTYASEYVNRIESPVQENEDDGEDPKEFLDRHHDLGNVRIQSYRWGERGRTTPNYDVSVPQEEAIKHLNGEYIVITWADGYSETLETLHTPMRVSGEGWEGSRLGYVTMPDGRREMVKLSRLPNVVYDYYRPIEITPGVRSTFQPLQRESVLQEALYKLSTTQINLPEDIANHVVEWGKLNIPNDAVYADEDGGKGRENEGHITCFYGITDPKPSAALGEIVAKTKPFLIELAGVSIFEGPEYDVVKIDVISEELTNLSNEIRAACPNENTFKVYRPHVTIAYVKKGRGMEFVGQDVFKDAAVKRDFWAYDIEFHGAGDSEDPDRVTEVLHFDKSGDPGHDEPANADQRYPQATEKEKEPALAESEEVDPKAFVKDVSADFGYWLFVDSSRDQHGQINEAYEHRNGRCSFRLKNTFFGENQFTDDMLRNYTVYAYDGPVGKGTLLTDGYVFEGDSPEKALRLAVAEAEKMIRRYKGKLLYYNESEEEVDPKEFLSNSFGWIAYYTTSSGNSYLVAWDYEYAGGHMAMQGTWTQIKEKATRFSSENEARDAIEKLGIGFHDLTVELVANDSVPADDMKPNNLGERVNEAPAREPAYMIRIGDGVRTKYFCTDGSKIWWSDHYEDAAALPHAQAVAQIDSLRARKHMSASVIRLESIDDGGVEDFMSRSKPESFVISASFVNREWPRGKNPNPGGEAGFWGYPGVEAGSWGKGGMVNSVEDAIKCDDKEHAEALLRLVLRQVAHGFYDFRIEPYGISTVAESAQNPFDDDGLPGEVSSFLRKVRSKRRGEASADPLAIGRS